eukprot:TRINITY_DN4641_c0_g2_i2.p1 TRINITY_DN4641_c0_g2~~TRINITY_DN4641_c0_g2_i2.p1  ORF type:complete len:365 (-),score=35.68 TRINITY_DN4641_c0_g2_i2:34-1128(-)
MYVCVCVWCVCLCVCMYACVCVCCMVRGVCVCVCCTVCCLSAHTPPLSDIGGNVCRWLRSSHRKRVTLKAHSSVLQVCFVANDRQILTQGREGEVKIWDAERFNSAATPLQTLSVADIGCGFCRCAIYQPDQHPLIAAFDGTKVVQWDLRESKPSVMFSTGTHAGLCCSLRYCTVPGAETPSLVGCFEDGRTYIWDTTATTAVSLQSQSEADAGDTCLDHPADEMTYNVCRPVLFSDAHHEHPALAVDVGHRKKNPGMLCGVSAGAADTICVFTLDVQQRESTTVETLKVKNAGINQVCVRPDQKIFATAGWDRRVRIWDWQRLRELAVLRGHTGSVSCLCFAPTDNTLLSGGADGRILAWNIY